MNQFVNKREDIVTEAIDGMIRTSAGALARLDGYPHIRVVVRNDWDKSQVALVSGGGSGHEPAHAGFVGRGMLTAAVCGDVFASPSVDAVLAGILAVTGSAGCLLIVKNYTGDRLNFGLAAERARALGLEVNMVIVDDDIALPDLPQPRGVAGTLLVHKIAGAMADAGASLDEVTTVAEKVIGGIKSLGMSLDTCTVPGSPKEERIKSGKAELGLGIHGEAGVEQIDYVNARQSVGMIVEKLAPMMTDEPHVVVLNNLGGVSNLEMLILAYELTASSIAGNLKWMVGPAAMMTSLDMRGFSVSVCPVSPQEETLLKSACALVAWPGCKDIRQISIAALPDGLQPTRPTPSKHADTAAFLTKCCDILITAESDLNALDAKSGDGDTGSTLAGAARALTGTLDRMPLADHAQLCRFIGQELGQTAGGSLGVLMAIFFTATGDALSTGLPMTVALKEGLKRMQHIGGAEVGDRTIVDALKPALDELEKGIVPASKAARKGAVHTSTITKAKAGRASYIKAEHLRGNIDPGAEAVARLFEQLST